MDIRRIDTEELKVRNFLFVDMTMADERQWHCQTVLFEGVIVGMCLRGELAFRINYRDFRVSAGEMFVSMPKYLFTFVDCSEDLDVKLLILSTDFLYGLPISFGFDWRRNVEALPCFSPSGQKLDDLIAIYNLLQHYDAQDPDSDQIRNALMLSFILVLVSMISGLAVYTTSMTLSYQERLTRRFFDLVSQHYLTRHNVSFYADQLCVTPKSLSAAIKNTTRHTTQEWLHEILLVDAKRCLKATDLTVFQISERLHFSTAAAFVRFFRQHTGYTPLEYRRK